MLVYSFPYRRRAFFACFPAPCGFCFYRFSHSSCAVRVLLSSCGCRFPRFPVPVSYRFLAVSHPGGRRFPSFLHFPVRFPHSLRSYPFVFARSWRAVWLCVIAYRPVPVSSSVSIFDAWGGEAMFVPWCWCSFRGVALRVLAGRPVVSVWRVVSCRCVGRGVLVGFFIWNYREGCSRKNGLLVCVGTSVASAGTPRGFICSLGAFFLVWIVLYTGCRCSISSCVVRWCGRRCLWWRVGRLRLMLALRLFGRVAGYRSWRWLRLVGRLAWASRVSSRS